MSQSLRRHMRDALLNASALNTDEASAMVQAGVVIGLAMAGESEGWMKREEAAGWRSDAMHVLSRRAARAKAVAAGFIPSEPASAVSERA